MTVLAASEVPASPATRGRPRWWQPLSGRLGVLSGPALMPIIRFVDDVSFDAA